jgi:hypothetical protein
MKNTAPTTFMKKGLTMLLLACSCIVATVPSASSAEDWKATFEDICSKVDASGTLSTKELETLIERADKLMPEIQRSDDPSKKVYLQRLKKCRSLYEFSIDLKKEPDK